MAKAALPASITATMKGRGLTPKRLRQRDRRLRTWPNGQVIRCRGSGIDSQPECVAAVHLDRAAFERPDGTELAEWRS